MSPSALAAPTLRQLPVPDCQPPFDDELPPGRASRHPAGPTQGTLALAFVLPNGLSAAPSMPSMPSMPGLRLVPTPAPPAPFVPDATHDEDEVDFGPQPTSSGALPDPREWSGRLVQAVAEVLVGDRPLGQLVRWTSTEVYDDIGVRVVPAARAGGRPVSRALVRSVHVSEPADGVAECAAVVRRGPRSTAIALRLEGLDGRWQCTALDLG